LEYAIDILQLVDSQVLGVQALYEFLFHELGDSLKVADEEVVVCIDALFDIAQFLVEHLFVVVEVVLEVDDVVDYTFLVHADFLQHFGGEFVFVTFQFVGLVGELFDFGLFEAVSA